MWIKDPKTKGKSVTLTMLVAVFVAVFFKFVTDGLTIGSESFWFIYTFPIFDASKSMAVLVPIATLYLGRKYSDKDKK